MSTVPPSGPPEPATLDLAVIGNCTVSALIDSRARIVWCCMPRMDGDPVFYALVDWPMAPGRTARWAWRSKALRARNSATTTPPQYSACASTTPMEWASKSRTLLRVSRSGPHLSSRTAGAPDLSPPGPPASAHHRPSAQRLGGNATHTHPRQQPPALLVGACATLRLTTNAPLTYIVDGGEKTWFSLFGPVSTKYPPGALVQDLVRRDRGDGARFRGADRPLLALLDATPGLAARVAGGGHPFGDHAQAMLSTRKPVPSSPR